MDFKLTFCYKCKNRKAEECAKFGMTIYRAWRHVNGCKIMGRRSRK